MAGDYAGHTPRVSDRDAILALARVASFGGDESARQLLADYDAQGVDQPTLPARGLALDESDDQGDDGEDQGDGEGDTPASRKAAKAAAAAQHRR